MIKKILTPLFCLFIAVSFLCINAAAVTHGEDIYIIGNNDREPYEYYDKKRQEFVGIVPEVFKLIEKKTKYNFIYLSINDTNRETLIKNSQADIISACIDDEFNKYTRTNPIFVFDSGNKKTEVRLAFTKNADSKLISEVNEALNSLTQSQKDQILISQAGKKEVLDNKIIFAVLFLFGGLLCLLFINMRNSKKLKRMKIFMFNTNYIYKYNSLKEAFKTKIVDYERKRFSLIYIKIDYETFSDIVLEWMAEFGEQIHSLLSDDEFLGYLPDSTFCVFIKNRDSEKTGEFVNELEKSRKELNKKFDNITSTVTYGVYRLNNSDRNLANVVNNGMQIYHYARKNNLFFSSHIEDNVRIVKNTEEIVKSIYTAVNKNEINHLFQPIFDISVGRFDYFSVVAEYNDSRLEKANEQEIRAYLNGNDKILSFDRQIIEDACKEVMNLTVLGQSNLLVFCNVSSYSLNNSRFITELSDILNKNKCPAERLVLSVNINDINKTREAILSLKNTNTKICIDLENLDWVSFNALSGMEVDFIKFNYKKDVLSCTLSNDLLMGIIDVLHKNDVKVIIDGVDTDEILEVSVDLKADYIKGAFCCSPLNIKDFKRFISNKNL